jgi:hypothetical protein
MTRASLGLVFVLVGVLAVPTSAQTAKRGVDVLSTFPATSGASPCGEQSAGGIDTAATYCGQLFVMPTTGIARDLTFQLRSTSGPDGLDFRVLLTTVTGTGDTLRPDDVLFESAAMTLPANSDWNTVTVPLSGLSLRGGTAYFWILDSWADFDGETGYGEVAATTGYSGGEFYATSVLAANSPTDPGTREDHFQQFSAIFTDFDLAFTLTYTETKRKSPKPPKD